MKFAITVIAVIALLVVANFIKINRDDIPTLSNPQDAKGIAFALLQGTGTDADAEAAEPIQAFEARASKGPTTIRACENSGGYPNGDFGIIKIEQEISQGVNIASDKRTGSFYFTVGFAAESKPTTLLGAIVRYFLPSQPYTQYSCMYPIKG